MNTRVIKVENNAVSNQLDEIKYEAHKDGTSHRVKLPAPARLGRFTIRSTNIYSPNGIPHNISSIGFNILTRTRIQWTFIS